MGRSVALRFALATLLLLACGRRTGLLGRDAGRDVPPSGTDAAAETGEADASLDGPISVVNGSCPVQGAYPRDGACICSASIPNRCPNPCFGRHPRDPDPACPLAPKEWLCVDLLNDPQNCGGCGITCAEASVCANGACGPTPTLVVPPVNGCTGMSLAVHGGNLYWTNAALGTVNRVPTAGGGVVTRGGLPGASHIHVFGDAIYWIVASANSLLKAPLVGGAPQLVVTIPDADDAMPGVPRGLQGFTVADDGTAYVSSGTRIYEVASAGTPERVVVEQFGGDRPGAPALDGTTIVFPLLIDGQVSAAALPAAGQPAARCGDTTPGAAPACWISITHEPLRDTIYVRNGRVFIAESLDKAIETFPTTRSSNRERIGELPWPIDTIDAFTIQGDWTFYVADGYVVRAPLVVGSVGTALVRNQPLDRSLGTQPSRVSIAADDTEVFWTTTQVKNGVGTCSIQRLKYR